MSRRVAHYTSVHLLGHPNARARFATTCLTLALGTYEYASRSTNLSTAGYVVGRAELQEAAGPRTAHLLNTEGEL